MKLKRLRKKQDPERGFEGLHRVHGPHKYEWDPNAQAKPTKPQRARRRRKLLEKYGPRPESPRPTDYMPHEERLQLRSEVLAAAGYQCEQCGNRNKLTLDHIVARHIGGGNHRENLQCLCQKCNAAKGLDIWKAVPGTTPTPFL
ncbi:MAG TPA: HNH endonuclease signature motif containing protein [Hymenobacter sp.]|jgi:5-methylcytosine-specific restriction endonuclease McrA